MHGRPGAPAPCLRAFGNTRTAGPMHPRLVPNAARARARVRGVYLEFGGGFEFPLFDTTRARPVAVHHDEQRTDGLHLLLHF
jgi:hypothetical protein